MSRVYNFSAGPAALPTEVLEQAQAEMLDWHGSGMSVMEMSHRGKDYMSIAAKAEAERSQRPILSLRLLGRLDEEIPPHGTLARGRQHTPDNWADTSRQADSHAEEDQVVKLAPLLLVARCGALGFLVTHPTWITRR